MANKALPQNPKKILLVNPTKYLGNLLLAGGLMQAFVQHCQQRHIECRIVLDESFRELCEASFPAGSVIWFPRRRINQAGFFHKLSLYLSFLRQMRRFQADLAFNIEEDSATSHLTRLSGASFKLGCSKARHRKGYDQVIPVDFENRPPERQHRWYSFLEVFSQLGMAEPASPAYIRLTLPQTTPEVQKLLAGNGINFTRPLVAIHAGATKLYKQWPLEYFSSLCSLLLEVSMQPVLLGAGADDRSINQSIVEALEHKGTSGQIINLCDKLSLRELAVFLQQCQYMIGNDSGPFHLGSAVGVSGSVIFGPTNKAIWRPPGREK